MKENIIRGRYFEVDFSKDIIIEAKDKEIIETFMADIIKENSYTCMHRYDQGFLEVKNPETLHELPTIMAESIQTFIQEIKYGPSLGSQITHYIQKLESNPIYDEDLISYIWEIYSKFETRMYYKDYYDNERYILKLICEDPQHLFELPQSVIAIIYETRPSALEIDILESKSIYHVTTKDKFGPGTYNKISLYNLGFLPGLAFEEESFISRDLGKFELGICIHSNKDILKASHLDPNYIIVEPEKAYVRAAGIACLSKRQAFYKKLFETFPESDIIVTLPKLEMLDTYFNQGNETNLDTKSILNHSSLFEVELKALFKYNHDKIILTIPDINDVSDYDQIRKKLDYLCTKILDKKVKIGLEVNTAYSTDNISLFRRINHAVINLNKGYDMMQPKDIYNLKYTMEYSNLRGILYRKSKSSYLIGKDLNNPKFMQKMIHRGFKKFTIKPELFDLFSTIIYRYNQGEPLYIESV